MEFVCWVLRFPKNLQVKDYNINVVDFLRIKDRRKSKIKMAVLKSKDIVKMNEKEREEKLKELKQELIKANVSARKSGKIKVKEIKKAIARILTAQRQMHK